MKFRKKPVVIDAWQWHKGEEFIGGMSTNDAGQPVIKTVRRGLEGELVVSDGDWVIQDVNGERHPCPPDIFEATYEPA